MDKTTHEVRLAYWKNIARKCQARPEGQTAALWLEENGIHNKQYYYWLRKIRGEAYEEMKAKSLPSADSSDIAFAEIPVNSIPIPELIKLITDDGGEEYIQFKETAKGLHWTSGYIISLGFKGTVPRPDLWDYIYDEDIYVSRYHSPSSMSAESAPDGCYSIQVEVYTKDGAEHEFSSTTIDQLDRIGTIRKSELIVKDIRFSKYCNIIFDHKVYENRDSAVDYLTKNGVIHIGRFGEWKCFWSDQSFMSGYIAAI